MSILETAVEISAEVKNYRLTAFSVELLANDKPKELIIEFYEYWNRLSVMRGIWIDEHNYSFDCNKDAVEEGVLFNVDNIIEMYTDFVCNIFPDILKVRSVDLDTLHRLYVDEIVP